MAPAVTLSFAAADYGFHITRRLHAAPGSQLMRNWYRALLDTEISVVCVWPTTAFGVAHHVAYVAEFLRYFAASGRWFVRVTTTVSFM